MTTKTPDWVKYQWDAEEKNCVRCGRSMHLRDGCEWDERPWFNFCDDCSREIVDQLETDRDQLRARVSDLEAENARLRLAAIEDAKDHDRRVTECERWADRLAEVERERDEARNERAALSLTISDLSGSLRDAAHKGKGHVCDYRSVCDSLRDKIKGHRERRELTVAAFASMNDRGAMAKVKAERDAATEALKRARVAIEQILAAYKLGGGFALVEAIQTEIARQDAAAALHDLAAAETDK